MRTWTKLQSLLLVTAMLVCTFAYVPAANKAYAITNSALKANILNYFSNLPNTSSNRVVSGTFGHFAPYAKMEESPQYVYDNTGKWAGIVGVDYGSLVDYTAVDYDEANALVKQYWNLGGIASISAHVPNPYDPAQGARGEPANNTDIFTSGTSAYTNWRNTLSAMADGLKQLKDQGIVVMWRPFHEMNGNWFWWGDDAVFAPADIKRLWTEMYDYFTNTRGLDNLIWVYSPFNSSGDGSDVDDYYPGAQYVDMVGLDVYTSSITTSSIKGYNQLIALNKPFGFTEFGSGDVAHADPNFDWLSFINGIRNNFPKTTFFLTWYFEYTIGEYGYNGYQFMNDSWIVSRDELPSFGANFALKKTATASSTESSGRAAEYAFDNSASTRWASQQSDNQWIYVDLGGKFNINRVQLHWENAYGKSYKIQVSNNAVNWTDIYSTTTGDGGFDNLTGLSGTGRYVRMQGIQRGTGWGYSLWEFEVYGTPVQPNNLASGKAVTVSSTSDNLSGSNATDGNGKTRWSSAFSEPQWIYVDLGSSKTINRIRLNWETAYGKSYKIQVSNDAVNWSDIYSTTTGDGGDDDFAVSGNGRYVRLYGTQRGTTYGYSLYEFQIYGE